jgi:hypothetical protein
MSGAQEQLSLLPIAGLADACCCACTRHHAASPELAAPPAAFPITPPACNNIKNRVNLHKNATLQSNSAALIIH